MKGRKVRRRGSRHDNEGGWEVIAGIPIIGQVFHLALFITCKFWGCQKICNTKYCSCCGCRRESAGECQREKGSEVGVCQSVNYSWGALWHSPCPLAHCSYVAVVASLQLLPWNTKSLCCHCCCCCCCSHCCCSLQRRQQLNICFI